MVCQKLFKLRTGSRPGKYCSFNCYWESKKGKIPWNKGVPASKDAIEKNRLSKLGRKAPNPFKKGNIPWNKGIKWDEMRGVKHWNWKGGKPKTNRRGTMTYGEYRKYLDWQKAVFRRDNWECRFCGKHGGVLHADHIKSWALFSEFRFDINNGRTLCPPCHTKTESYGRTISRLKKYHDSLV